MSNDSGEQVPDEAEQLDQLDVAESLVDRGVDPLDEGYIAPDHWSPAEGFGNTAQERARGETLAQRMAQEEPDYDPDNDTWSEEHVDDSEVGERRAGRLVDANRGYPGEDREASLIGEDVGIDGAAASAEEAAMHVIDDNGEARRYAEEHREPRERSGLTREPRERSESTREPRERSESTRERR